jgi:ABC-type transport system involved in multi-copper enzyme maturation permease subunit
MKFLAILKDSIREAFDAKIIYFLFGLSVLVVVFMFSISFRPLRVEEMLRQHTEMMTVQIRRQYNEAMRLNRINRDLKGEKDIGEVSEVEAPRLDIEDFNKVSGGSDPWDGEYRFHFVITFSTPVQAQLARDSKPPLANSIPDILRGADLQPVNPWVDTKNTKATLLDADPAAPRQVAYQVDLKTTISDSEHWPNEPTLLFGLWSLPIHFPRGEFAGIIVNVLVNSIGAGFTLLISTIITAFFIPNMLRKGTIDMLVVKPIHRTTLLLYKYVGGLTFMFVNTAVVVVGVYLALGVRSGVWINGFLLSILVLTFEFAIYYAFSTLFAVLTRSVVVAILMTCLLYIVLWVVGTLFTWVELTRKSEVRSDQLNPGFVKTVDAIHFVLPRIKDLDVLNQKLVMDSLPHDTSRENREQVKKLYESFNWGENITVSLAFIAVMLGFSCWWFSTRDY